jgi:hypothetical protein
VINFAYSHADLSKRSVDSVHSAQSEAKSIVEGKLKEQLQFRHQLLEARVDDVNVCKDIIKDLVANHAHALQHKLVEGDLKFKRSILSPHDLEAIMSTKRLTALCIACGATTEEKGISSIPVQAFGNTGKYNYFFVSGTETFKPVLHRLLRPDDPPAIIMQCLPGTTRKPLKAWQLCSLVEKQMEIALACSLDSVLQLAIIAKVAVPSPEDVTLLPGFYLTREAKVKKFIAWYAGEEEVDIVPGNSPPTEQRVVLAEEWEIASVQKDPWVLESLIENEYPVPDLFKNIAHPNKFSFDIASQKSMKFHSANELDYTPLIELYSDVISKLSGTFLRLGLLSRHLSAVLGSRRMSLMRWLWPPGAARTGRQFLFPRMGLATPVFDLPARRMKPFPSRRPESYTYAEMLAWHSLPAGAVDPDDAAMIAGEIEGVRLRSYHSWLAQEKERQAQTRENMMTEDFDARMRREINREVEYRINMHAKKLRSQAERARDISEDPEAPIDLRFGEALPAEYWYIFEQSVEFKHGSGVHNEDEMEEYREAERQRARDAEIEAEKFENYLQEEIFKREQEELARQKREEQDRRLAEVNFLFCKILLLIF